MGNEFEYREFESKFIDVLFHLTVLLLASFVIGLIAVAAGVEYVTAALVSGIAFAVGFAIIVVVSIGRLTNSS